ncbi:ImpA family type VI secretion system protein [Jannaschia aquimarina]|uniref:ImpA N-terminal domain-containing protein n=1 Tax=Jannaschia aquimarina TaxID=935700 RepID=A0A0D1CT09_9RHOB|nr:type VI secretion system ImpA family N-terminal domain-containing protein [Jannaschia aquimarina]KIT17897.1 hypothetical protein jaqu_03220 [Jannaschia aquimarina]SNT23417.1 type VI secretion system protein ImpA [Jannaschia aquimarina]
MALQWLTEPVDPDNPCGPDLEREDDDAFIEYYFDAEGRLPERYVTAGMASGDGTVSDRLYDPKSVDLAAELKEIDGLLRRSRDLRLLSLRTRWQALARDTAGLAETLEGAAEAVGTFGEAMHPMTADAGRERRAALEAFAAAPTVLQPLQYLPLTGDDAVSWRRWQMASGRIAAPEDEEIAPEGLLQALGERMSAHEVDRIQGDLARALTAARRIGSPHVAPLVELLDGICGLIAQARPDLAAPDEVAPTAPEAVSESGPEPVATQAASNAAPEPAPPKQPEPQVGDLTSQSEARGVLAGVEGYLTRHEPSSAALLLVVQARQLVGRPLVEAIETLMPQRAGQAVIDFGPGAGFALPMDRLRQLSEASAGQAQSPEPEPPEARIDSRPEAAAKLRAAERWFRQAEPASPIPILLAKARIWLEKDFEAIMTEILPPSPQSPQEPPQQ